MIGQKIRSSRKKKGFSQVELASIVGIAQASLSSIESGKTEPLRKTLVALSRALGDNFGDSSLDAFADYVQPSSKKEIARDLSAQELISLKFGGAGGRRTSAETRALAKLLDEAIAKDERVLGSLESDENK